MSKIHLKVITPKKIILDENVVSVSAPGTGGEITILPRHVKLFALLGEGVVKIRKESNADILAIGGGYLETDGKELNILVSKSYGQDEIDQELTQKAITDAQKIISRAKDQKERQEVIITLRRSLWGIKQLKRKNKSSTL